MQLLLRKAINIDKTSKIIQRDEMIGEKLETKDKGTLSIVGTPIGNLEDMSFRAIRTLKEADLIAAEDTRHTRKLLNYYDIETPMASYHKFNEKEIYGRFIARLKGGENIALVSDAGMPVISDPGHVLVAACREAEIDVRVVPGPNAAVCAVALSGMDVRRFCFMGFLSKKNKIFREELDMIGRSTVPSVIYESPHRIEKTLEAIKTMMPERTICISREITKQHEETLSGNAAKLLDVFSDRPPKGEFVMIIDGAKEASKPEDISALCEGDPADHLLHYEKMGLSEKEAMKAVAKDRGITKRDVYRLLKVK